MSAINEGYTLPCLPQGVGLPQAKQPALTSLTGIYAYDDAHPIGGPGFKEDDRPNFGESFYSYTKSRIEDAWLSNQSQA
jgi:hypothetical protein